MTMDGVTHDVGKWDLLIAHPPCTHLAVSGARWFAEGRKPLRLREEAAFFFMKFIDADVQFTARLKAGAMSRIFANEHWQAI